MNITVRKEVVQCKKCKHNVEFLYVSDFSYGERIVLYNSGEKYAYINLLEDKTYNCFSEDVEKILCKYKKNITKEEMQNIVEMAFKLTCDEIDGSIVDFKGERQCENCKSKEFTDLLVEPEKIMNVEIPEVTHVKWNALSENDRKQNIIKFLEVQKII